LKIAWGITGADYLLDECISLLREIGSGKVDIFLSRAAIDILERYGWLDPLREDGFRIKPDLKASSPEIISLFTGKYSVLVVAPATSNSVAKFVYGISDTLITNLFAQAGKIEIPIVVLPTDHSPVISYRLRSGKEITLYPRDVDLRNVEKLKEFKGVKVVKSVVELEEELKGKYL
jgi:flavoprotein